MLQHDLNLKATVLLCVQQGCKTCGMVELQSCSHRAKLASVASSVDRNINVRIFKGSSKNNKRFGSLWWGSTYVLVTIGERFNIEG